MSLLIAEVELRIALVRKRLLVLNMLVPLLLVVPVVLGAAPAFHASAVYAVLFMLFGTFGSAIPLVRDAEMGLVGRILQTGIRPGGFLVQRAAVAGDAHYARVRLHVRLMHRRRRVRALDDPVRCCEPGLDVARAP